MVSRDRFGLNEDEKQQMIREVSLMGKLTWLLPVLGFKRISPGNLKVIRRLVETRNTFVHFQYKLSREHSLHDEVARLKSLLGKVEKARSYLEEYEAKQLYSCLKGFFPEALEAMSKAKASNVKMVNEQHGAITRGLKESI